MTRISYAPLLSASLLILMTAPPVARCAVLRVPTDHPTIQAAVDAAAPGDTVLVAPGTYSGAGNRDVVARVSIELRSEAGASRTLIDCGGSEEVQHRAFVFDLREAGPGAEAHVEGFTIRNSSAELGAIRALSSTLTIIDCFIEDSLGQGISARFSSLQIQRSTIANNLGGGVNLWSSSLTCVSSVFANNVTNGPGGAFFANQSDAHFIRCTFVGNGSRARRGSHIALGAGTVSVRRSILAFGLGGTPVYGGSYPADVSCSNIYGNADGNWAWTLCGARESDGNFSSDPQFCDADGGDWTLAATSPCLPGNHPGDPACGLVGALGEGCESPSPVPPTDWSIAARSMAAGEPRIDSPTFAEPGRSPVPGASEPTGPAARASTAEQPFVTDLIADGDLVYASATNAGMIAFDVSNPEAPAILWSLDPAYNGYGIAYTRNANRTAYVTGWPYQLLLVDLFDPESPRLFHRLPHRYASAVSRQVVHDLEAKLVHLVRMSGNHYSEFRTYDVSNPRSPELTGLAPIGRALGRMASDGTQLYIGERGIGSSANLGMTIIDASDPFPAVIGRVTTTPEGFATGLQEDRVYLATRERLVGSELVVIDVSDPYCPEIVNAVPLPRSVLGEEIVCYGAHAFLAAGRDGLFIFDLTDRDAPELVRMDPEPVYAMEIVEERELAYVSRGASLAVLDITDPTTPVTIGAVVTPVTLSGLEAAWLGDRVRISWVSTGSFASYRILRAQGETPREADWETIAETAPVASGRRQVEDASALPGAVYSYLVRATDRQGDTASLGPITVRTTAAPPRFALLAPWPNPTRGAASIAFEAPGAGPTDLAIYSADGRLVRSLEAETVTAGSHVRLWDGLDDLGRPLASGFYFVKLRTPTDSATRKLTVLR